MEYKGENICHFLKKADKKGTVIHIGYFYSIKCFNPNKKGNVLYNF